jgi:asparagine synthase (glutamine-hydrolysing)
MHQVTTIERLVDLLDPAGNVILNMTVDEAIGRVGSGDPEQVRGIDGQFALLHKQGKVVRMARSIGRPMRYFIAKRHEGPCLVVAERIDQIADFLREENLDDQFHPSYTRMVPAHFVTEVALVGCPDPNPQYIRYFTPVRNRLANDLDAIGRAYIGALADECAKWLDHIDRADSSATRGETTEPHGNATNPNPPSPPRGGRAGVGGANVSTRPPIGVLFSGGVDSGAVFLVLYHLLLSRGDNPARLKAFTLSVDGGGKDVAQARAFLESLDLGLFHETIEVTGDQIDIRDAIRVIEDYKPLDVQAAAMGLALCRGIRARYPDWKYLADGDGGDENLKDYPIEENPELTIRSVLNNMMLYHEGWGVGAIKHSLTYTGGQSRGHVRSSAPARILGFEGFSPFALPNVIEVAEGIPFIDLTDWSHDRLYALKGEITRRGVQQITGLTMPVCEKRRFQHGAIDGDEFAARFPKDPAVYRKVFAGLYA